jgi:uncharacterized protein
METEQTPDGPDLNGVIERLYRGFGGGDAEAMSSCYHRDAHFSDPVFTDLEGSEVMKMWRTLIGRSTDLEITLGDHAAEPDPQDPGAGTGSAHWTAVYTFAQTGRKVTNEIDADFRFEDGLIIDHRDDFDFWKWTRMALGTPGVLLGWSPFLRKKVQGQSAELLENAGPGDPAAG